MLSIIEALRIMCDYFDDDKQLGRYIRVLTNLPTGSLNIDELKTRIDKFERKHFADDFDEGRDSSSITLDEMLHNAGIRKNER